MNSQDAYSYRTLMVRLAHLEQQAEMLEDRVLIMEVSAERLKESVAEQYEDMLRRAVALHDGRLADD